MFSETDTPGLRVHPVTRRCCSPATILHSRADDVVPFADSGELVRNPRLAASVLIEVGSDHRLADAGPLKVMSRRWRTRIAQVRKDGAGEGSVRIRPQRATCPVRAG